MGVAVQVDVELHTVNCGCCGGVYAINERYRQKQYQDGGSWTCPYCKVSWGYANNNENAKLKQELAAEKERKERALAEANQLRASLTAQKAQTTKAKKQLLRTKNGVCPCCTRSFTNLRRHMATKHPDFAVNGEVPRG
jgi:hypothetical protein